MLTFALIMSALMGIFQETLYKQYGKHSKEALFYNVSEILGYLLDQKLVLTSSLGLSNEMPTVQICLKTNFTVKPLHIALSVNSMQVTS